MHVKVKLDDGAFMPERAHETDAGADIRTRSDFTIEPKCSQVVHTGVHIETPPGCVTLIKSKSGLNVNHSITTTGVIDEGYNGEIVVKMINHGWQAVDFKRGDKITQLLIAPIFYPGFIEVDEISAGERGSDGFGSTDNQMDIFDV